MDPLLPEEPLARFIHDKNYYRPSDRSIRHSAFMPARKDKQVSVFRISGLAAPAIWEIGNRYVATPLRRSLLGRADIKASDPVIIGLQVTPDDNPPRHANIGGWPEDASKHKLLAIQLAEKASLRLISDKA